MLTDNQPSQRIFSPQRAQYDDSISPIGLKEIH